MQYSNIICTLKREQTKMRSITSDFLLLIQIRTQLSLKDQRPRSIQPIHLHFQQLTPIRPREIFILEYLFELFSSRSEP